MMQLDTWTITGPGFHFGEQGLGQEGTSLSMPSDSLFAALLSRLLVTQGKAALDALAARFTGGPPPFVLSSTFLYAGSVRFFPAPALHAPASQASHKDLKKVTYLSEALFRQVLAGQSLAGLYEPAEKLQGKAVLVSQEELPGLPSEVRERKTELWHVEKRPRVTLGRAVQNSNIYFTGRVSFAAGCGLWFAVRWLEDDPILKSLLARLLHDLGDAGLGGERSVGFGACRIQPGLTLELPEPGDDPWVTLSRYLPQESELEALAHPQAAYQLVSVGGWLSSPASSGQRRRAVNLMAEGSVFGPLGSAVPGMIADVRPSYPTDEDPLEHPVYRCGLALGVGLKGA